MAISLQHKILQHNHEKCQLFLNCCCGIVAFDVNLKHINRNVAADVFLHIGKGRMQMSILQIMVSIEIFAGIS